jgi:hypothetical protein
MVGEDRIQDSIQLQPYVPPSMQQHSLDVMELIHSTEGGVQTYTANFQNGAGVRKKIHGGVPGGDGYPKEGQLLRHKQLSNY